MANDLPPLPTGNVMRKHEDVCGNEVGPPSFYFTADQMHAYARDFARAAVQAEREACAKACESQGRHAGDGLTFYTATGQCAAAIRARSTP